MTRRARGLFAVWLDDRPAPVEPAFTVTPWETRSLAPEELARQRQAKTEAQTRARQLLLRHLPEAQRAEFEATGMITEVLPSTGDRVQISASSVRLLDDQYPTTTRARYCLVPHIDEYIPPIEDVILARLLLLRHAPERFFSTANQLG